MLGVGRWQVVVQEQTEPVDLTGVPEYLRIAAKPLVDAIVRHAL